MQGQRGWGSGFDSECLLLGELGGRRLGLLGRHVLTPQPSTLVYLYICIFVSFYPSISFYLPFYLSIYLFLIYKCTNICIYIYVYADITCFLESLAVGVLGFSVGISHESAALREV